MRETPGAAPLCAKEDGRKENTCVCVHVRLRGCACVRAFDNSIIREPCLLQHNPLCYNLKALKAYS